MVCSALNGSKPFSNGRGHKSRAQWVSQSERFVTGGDPPMRATSLYSFIIVGVSWSLSKRTTVGAWGLGPGRLPGVAVGGV